MIGPTIRHGPHHSAQKSTTAIPGVSKTVLLKLLSVNSNAILIVLNIKLSKQSV
jgi:hypothetical protein